MGSTNGEGGPPEKEREDSNGEKGARKGNRRGTVYEQNK